MASKVVCGFKILLRIENIEHVRFYRKWIHRRPIRIINDNSNDNTSDEHLQKIHIESQPYIAENTLVGKVSTPFRADKYLDEVASTPLSNNESDAIHRKVDEELINTNTKRAPKEINIEKTTKHPERIHQAKATEHDPKQIHKEKTTVISDKIKVSAQKLGIPVFTKLQEDDPKISNAMMVIKSRNKRQKKNLILLEGKHLIKDAIEAGVLPHVLFFSKVSDIKELPIPDHGIELYKLPYKILSLWSDLTTSPGIIGIARTPLANKNKPDTTSMPLTIICDNVRDPGNLGSILRAAAGVGCTKVVLTKGCVDLWEPKVLRSGAGSHFRVPIHQDISWDLVDEHIDKDSVVYLADNKSGTIEENGNNKYNNDRTRLIHQTIVKETTFNSHNEDLNTAENKERNDVSSIPILPYYAVDFRRQSSMVLVIGGETEGLSDEAFRLVHRRSGVRLNIPLSNDVESLNTGTALGIVVFEMKRQFLRKTTYLYSDSEDEESGISDEQLPLSNI